MAITGVPEKISKELVPVRTVALMKLVERDQPAARGKDVDRKLSVIHKPHAGVRHNERIR